MPLVFQYLLVLWWLFFFIFFLQPPTHHLPSIRAFFFFFFFFGNTNPPTGGFRTSNVEIFASPLSNADASLWFHFLNRSVVYYFCFFLLLYLFLVKEAERQRGWHYKLECNLRRRRIIQSPPATNSLAQKLRCIWGARVAGLIDALKAYC